MAKREKAWEIGLHLGKEIGIPTSIKGTLTGFGAGMTVGGLISKDDPLLIAGLVLAFIGVTA